MTVHIECWAQRFLTHIREKVTEAIFVFVSIDENGKPQPVDR
jgi:acyl-CoA thioesterase YciA